MRNVFRITLAFIIPLLLFWHEVSLAAEKKPAPKYREIKWEELVPASWQPEKLFAKLNLDKITDDSPEAARALKIIAEEWKNAPANPALQDQSVKLPGYVVPLDWEGSATLKEFLLVPYFGACVHTPPPPANQIVHVRMNKPAKGVRAMDAVWVYGKLRLERNDSGDMGSSSYSMRPDKVELYK
ncbi:MAG: DUF3299 domain-containing protein [Betaproteobacteria bacterium]|nr:DUF3299 domain-containing protein [Betaproteobacteria bacterium]